MAQIQADAGGWVDEIMANVRTLLEDQGLQIIPMPDLVKEFEKEIMFVTWRGEASLRNGWLAGMESIHRSGVADITTNENGEMFITVEIGVNQGTIGYDCAVHFMDLGPDATISGTLEHISVLIQVKVGQNLRASLEQFDIRDLGHLTGHVDGLGFTGILDFLAEILIDTVGDLLKGVVFNSLEGTIKDQVNKVIDSTLYPTSPQYIIETIAAAKR